MGSYPLLGGGTAGERRNGGVICPRRDTPPPGRRVGFFARILSFFAVQKKMLPRFFLPTARPPRSSSTLRRSPYKGAPWSRSTACPPLHPPSTAPRRIKCVPDDERERVFNI